jgi:rare lipoprotein A
MGNLKASRLLVTTATLLGLTAAGFSVDALARVRTAPPTGSSAVARVRHWFETGTATWYDRHLQGHKTATGERYDMNSLTCAHRTLPLGSWVRVTNLLNKRSIFVRVNDRGPYGDKRIVDLSYAAARAVGMDGTAKVKLEPVSPSDPEIARALVSQLGTPLLPFSTRR